MDLPSSMSTPFGDLNENERAKLLKGRGRNLAFLLDEFGLSRHRKNELTEAYTDNGWEWWNLSPSAQTHNTPDDRHGFARGVVLNMLKCVSMRRGMDTITRLPNHADGKEWLICPRDGMPPHMVETHELAFGINKPEIDALMNQHFQDLSSSNFDTTAQEDNIMVGEEQYAADTAENPGGEEEPGKGLLDAGLLRILTIASMDYLSYKAMLSDDSVAQMSDEEIMKDLMAANEPVPVSRSNTKEHMRTREGGAPILGADHTEAVLHGTGDLGLSYLQLLGLDDPFDFIPVERKAVLSRVLCRSPLNLRTLEICGKQAAEGNRVLVMCGTPWEQL